jgi:hypothetical protein
MFFLRSIQTNDGKDAAMTEMLTARQEAFCRAFVAGAGSAADAARQAGYSAQTARAQASRLLHTPAVSARIDALRAESEQARAAFCARLMAHTRRLAERAEAEGKLGLAMRGVAMQMQLVKQFGMPALPADTAERTLDGLGAEPAAVCGDVAVGEPDPAGTGAAPADVAAITEAKGTGRVPAAALRPCAATRVDGCERADAPPACFDGREMEAASGEMGSVSAEPASNESDRGVVRHAQDAPRASAHAPAHGAASRRPASPAPRVINGPAAATLRGFALTDVVGCERVRSGNAAPPEADDRDARRAFTYAGYRPLPPIAPIAPTEPGNAPYGSTRATRDSPRRAASG